LDLAERLRVFLAATEVPGQRFENGKTVDLRRDVLNLSLSDGVLWLTMAKGSPLLLSAHLLGLSPEKARGLMIRKTAAIL
jgi:hypothetical protein